MLMETLEILPNHASSINFSFPMRYISYLILRFLLSTCAAYGSDGLDRSNSPFGILGSEARGHR